MCNFYQPQFVQVVYCQYQGQWWAQNHYVLVCSIALNEEWNHATCTPSPPEPWQVGGSFDVQVAAPVPHYMRIQRGPPHLSELRKSTYKLQPATMVGPLWEAAS